MRTPRKPLVLVLTALGLTGCGAGAVNLEPAPDAANPTCAYALVAMPDTVSGLAQRETTAQATTAWGDPSAVILKCGVELGTAPVSDTCVSVNGVDWIVKPADEELAAAAEQTATGTWVAETFGRDPAVQVTFDADRVSSSTVLAEVSSAVAQIPQQMQCTNVDDTLTGVDSGTGS
ncbi:DUF3515 family protein [Rothia sp. SD9660Na]|uniref:DUF3515 family protein n=1 Tax=Rothia sp. SD9660Na TaxID=3047030 RepID=UPI0024BAA448|nr:DUF3515 family protein [Rothia sp. SD9660Na]WHS51228.1 DUF3515 family protein [Rothia sp. SD9660Na]